MKLSRKKKWILGGLLVVAAVVAFKARNWPKPSYQKIVATSYAKKEALPLSDLFLRKGALKNKKVTVVRNPTIDYERYGSCINLPEGGRIRPSIFWPLWEDQSHSSPYIVIFDERTIYNILLVRPVPLCRDYEPAVFFRYYRNICLDAEKAILVPMVERKADSCYLLLERKE